MLKRKMSNRVMIISGNSSTIDSVLLKATSSALIQIVPLPVFAYLTVRVRTPIVVSYVVPYALVVCIMASPIARSSRTPWLVDHRLMTLMEQMDRMLGRGYRSGRRAQNDRDRKSNV